MSDRKKAIERLRAVEFTDEMDSFGMLSEVGRAVWPSAMVWTPLVCRIMCDELIELLEDADAEIDAVRHECERRIERVVDGVVPLPLDVDGNAIHVGDWVAGKDNTAVHWKWLTSFRVGCLVYRSTGWEVIVVSPDTCNVYTYPCDMLRVTKRKEATS
jgi:hypothetical protein